ncbi:ComEC/Rec2 family competence protein [Campylobacter sp. MIT 21-1685]|uniref:ComEC/Rec2 family competence protein n=1 Tax=unclassified Campylobacter TaxID=2593542 RepID=UPI00224AFF29|nr:MULTISPECIES: ComEC/Rec2 family competence protein [unclassified Campylobacter]MCX2682542.1 ComEC/Rec2 family competence protein [Campylobacter sp. MIT 21-1684]MCX2750745.1 ComEC/Rec2 family competence protein [Campylobacter sp. MIT 21-1682]MCX2807023.1 ComEC/Rec2 family competence protein [Campylobacter sp. MIT 21-1685]
MQLGLGFIKEFSFFFALCLIVFIFNLSLEYKDYLAFKQNKHQHIENAKVLGFWTKTNKQGKTYWVLKFQTKNFDFYTTSYKEPQLIKNQRVALRILTSNIHFKDYLSKSFYTPSYDIRTLQENPQKNALIEYFLNQHQNEKIREFYGALFFALGISKELRNDVSHYGISHLIAISGYHIGFLFACIFFLFTPVYSFFQKHYFPYRNAKLDLTVIIFCLLFAYASLLGFTPSFVRSLAMALWVFYLISKNIKILNFLTLLMSLCICIALYPRLLFSLGFLFSTMGVFFIFLYLHHFRKYFNTTAHIFFLNIWTFFAMTIPVLHFFPLLSYQQFFSIIINLVFAVFYPLVLFLHLIQQGGIFDSFLLYFFSIKLKSIDFYIPLWIFFLYTVCSLISIRFRLLALFCVFANCISFIWLLL